MEPFVANIENDKCLIVYQDKIIKKYPIRLRSIRFETNSIIETSYGS